MPHEPCPHHLWCRSLFKQHLEEAKQSLDKIAWAEPGKERQDSVYNGLQAVGSEAQLVAVHDSARPLVTAAEAAACMCDANQVNQQTALVATCGPAC